MPTTRIVVLDDDSTKRRMLRLILERDAQEVWEAASIGEAFKLIETHPAPHLAIVDLHLDSESGVDFLWQVRGDPLHGTLPVLFYSGTPERAAVVEAMKLGTLGFLALPVDRNRLKLFVNKARMENWMQAHFEPAEIVCRRLSTDREKLRELVRLFFSSLVQLVDHGLESQAELAAVRPQIAALCRTAGDLGLTTVRAALASWEAGGAVFQPPPLLVRHRTLARMFAVFST